MEKIEINTELPIELYKYLEENAVTENISIEDFFKKILRRGITLNNLLKNENIEVLISNLPRGKPRGF